MKAAKHKSNSHSPPKNDKLADKNSKEDTRSELEKQLLGTVEPPKAKSSPAKDDTAKAKASRVTKKATPPSKEPSTSESPPIAVPHPASIKSIANGILPIAGKPMMLSMDKKTKRKIMNPRGRPKAKPFVAMYHSQIKDNNVGIKLCIKKSEPSVKVPKVKQQRKRKSKSKAVDSDSEQSEVSEKRRRKENKTKSNNNEQEGESKQSPYGNRLPEHILHKVSLPPAPMVATPH